MGSRDMTVGPLLTAAVGAWESTGVVYSNLSRNGASVSGLVTVGSLPGVAWERLFALRFVEDFVVGSLMNALLS